ncbi:MAG: VacB/RNase II family 3'-5' exoribonuclease [Verrucomicrobia bacterium]|nr:VacB/RNase II family 3'-5' exoribonuclease [Verrucomicrobiota bacterium]
MSRKKKKAGSNSKLAKNLEKTLLQYIQGKRYSPLTALELIEQLDIPEVHQQLFEEILKDLVETKILVCERGRYFIPNAERKLTTGVISVHPKGFGFVKVDAGSDVFIPKHAIQGAVDGDTVEIEIAAEVSAKGPEGVVIAIVKRSRTHIAGTIIGKSGRHYHAYSPIMGPDKPVLVKAPKGMTLQEGDRIICKVTQWHNESDLVEATATSCIGNISDPSIDIDAAIQEFELPDGFTQEALEEARQYGKRIGPKEIKNRRDLTEWETVTIDPDTARDYDDAISLTTDSKGHYHLGVHIADVAHYVKPGMHLDKEAFTRCNSTYFPGKCVPMLPEELSNELCSLKPSVIRLTQSVLAEFDPTGKLVHVEICRSAIKSKKRFTYKEALAVLLKKKKSVHAPLLERMTQLCALFKAHRSERGSIDFAMSDDVVIVDEKGVPQKLERIEYDITHQMIEEFMLKANELVAIHLNKQGKTLIYRVHEEPSDDSFQDFFTFARSMGFKLPAKPTHRDIQKMFAEAKDSPLIEQLSVSFIRSMRLACYSPENIGHYGLALEHYCHFTSPIRRYSDLIIQRLLFDEIAPDVDLFAIANACSERERVSFRAENSVVVLKKLRLAKTYFDEDPTKVYPAVVTKVKPFQLFFEIPMFDLEGSLHISQIGNDYYEYNPQRMQFRGSRSGAVYGPGQLLEVRLDRIDLVLHQSQWSIVPSQDTPRASRKKK